MQKISAFKLLENLERYKLEFAHPVGEDDPKNNAQTTGTLELKT